MDSSTQESWLEVTGSPQLPDWLAAERVSLAMTTYQTGKLILLGLQPNGRLGVFERKQRVFRHYSEVIE